MLRAGNLPGVTRAAYLRELFGDLDGSVELMNMAYQSTPPSEVENHAWLLTQVAHLQLTSGETAEAENKLHHALAILPDTTTRWVISRKSASSRSDMKRLSIFCNSAMTRHSTLRISTT